MIPGTKSNTTLHSTSDNDSHLVSEPHYTIMISTETLGTWQTQMRQTNFLRGLMNSLKTVIQPQSNTYKKPSALKLHYKIYP